MSVNPVNDIFGRIITGSQVEGAAILTLEKWFQTYLYEMEIQLDFPDRHVLPKPRSWTVHNRIDEIMSEDQLPQVVVVSPGLSDRPVRDGEGNYRAGWRLGVGVVVSAKDGGTTSTLARLYAAASRAIMLQKGSLGGIALETEWVDERFDPVPIPDRTRTLMVAVTEFTIWVEYVVNKLYGPAEPYEPDPDHQPGSQWPTAQEVIIDIKRREDDKLAGEIVVHA